MGIFNNKRMGFLSKKGLYKYLLYGIGEIILVVIGILIAVSINNRNERKASEKRLQSYLEVYHQDLETDTLIVSSVIKALDAKKEYFNLFLSDTVSRADYFRKPQGFGLILSYLPFKLQQKGANLLDKYVDDTKIEQDTLISQIITNHKYFDNILDEINKLVGDDINNHLDYLKENEPWVTDILLGKMTDPRVLDYFLSEKYKARLAIHHMLLYNNLNTQLKQLQKNHLEILEEVNKRIDQHKLAD